jgi:hypothetical protein
MPADGCALLVLEVIKNQIECVIYLVESVVHTFDELTDPERDHTDGYKNHRDKESLHDGLVFLAQDPDIPRAPLRDQRVVECGDTPRVLLLYQYYRKQ